MTESLPDPEELRKFLAGLDDPAAELAAVRDIQDRVVAALIALINGDQVGADAVLAGINQDVALHLVMPLCVRFGVAASGPEGFTRALLRWRDDIATIEPPDQSGRGR